MLISLHININYFQPLLTIMNTDTGYSSITYTPMACAVQTAWVLSVNDIMRIMLYILVEMLCFEKKCFVKRWIDLTRVSVKITNAVILTTLWIMIYEWHFECYYTHTYIYKYIYSGKEIGTKWRAAGLQRNYLLNLNVYMANTLPLQRSGAHCN